MKRKDTGRNITLQAMHIPEAINWECEQCGKPCKYLEHSRIPPNPEQCPKCGPVASIRKKWGGGEVIICLKCDRIIATIGAHIKGGCRRCACNLFQIERPPRHKHARIRCQACNLIAGELTKSHYRVVDY